MTQERKRGWLIKTLLSEQPNYHNMEIPKLAEDQRRLLRSLFNLRLPMPMDEEFLQIQDAYLQEELFRKGITDFSELEAVQNGIYLWKGNITTLRADAIVNAANSGMTGCYCPCHGCIDNAIHTFAGVQLRLACAELMEKQGYVEPAGTAKITPAFNLPCDHVLHTVGPIVSAHVTKKDCNLLESCYSSCLTLADQNGLGNIAFCCISTGEFHFPNDIAAEIAINTVKEYQKRTNSKLEVIFNVFKETDYEIYRGLLQINQ